MRIKNKIVGFILLAGLLIPLVSAMAVSLKVSPAELEIKTSVGIKEKQEITIENPGNNVALFEVYPDEFDDWIKTIPASFTLEAGEKREVTVEVENSEQGIFSTYLSVVAKPLNNNKLSANSGIKIPLRVVVSGSAGAGTLSAMVSRFFHFDSLAGVLLVISIFVAILALVKLFIARKKNLA